LLVELVRQGDLEGLVVSPHDRTVAPTEEVAQALCEIGVIEPQSDGHRFLVALSVDRIDCVISNFTASLPAGVVQRVDLDSETVFVDRTKDEIKDAPEFDETNYREEPYRSRVGDYYYGRTTTGGTSEDIL
jgi:hypothetical protein